MYTINLRKAGFLPVKLSILDHTNVQTPAYSCGILDNIYSVLFESGPHILKNFPTASHIAEILGYYSTMSMTNFYVSSLTLLAIGLLHIQGRT